MEEEIAQAVKNNIMRKVSVIGPQKRGTRSKGKPLSIDPHSFLIVKVHRRGPFPPPGGISFCSISSSLRTEA